MVQTERKGLLPWIFKGVLLIGFLILLARLLETQVIKGAYFSDLAEGNRIRRVPITPERGEIHARGGEILVGNEEVKKKLIFSPEKGFVKEDINEPGEGVEISEWQRLYKVGSTMAHVSGYLGEVDESEVGKVNPDCPNKGIYKTKSLVGRSGLEQKFECTLSGVEGEMLFEVDSRGRLVRTLGVKPPQKGENVITNIDTGLQQKAATLMDGKRGVIVATDAKGEILALYSSPSFDPNIFVGSGDSKKISALFQDKEKPFFNRAIGGLFHPGSIFKPIVAAAALEEGVIDRHFIYDDTGRIIVKTGQGDFSYSNWFFTQYGGVEGNINLSKALARSTDTFFYKVGEMLGVNRLVTWAERFGLGEKTGIDLPGEVAGLVPSPEWKKRVKGENWFLGNTYHMSIGQGDLALTPLAMNMATSAIFTGKLCTPKLVGESSCKELNIKKENSDFIKEGMIAACSEGGTASAFFDWNAKEPDDKKVACKTGTAETGVNDKSHAWFSVVAPASPSDAASSNKDSNRISLTVLVEEGGEGSQVAAPIAREILNYWFKK
jgi:penicillin-binding protein 2